MKTKLLFTALLCLAAITSGGVHAETVTVAASEAQGQKTHYDAIDTINSDNALLAAQIKNAQLRKTLADIQAGRDPSNQQGSAPANPMGVSPMSGIPNNSGAMSGQSPAFQNVARGAVVLKVSTSPQVNNNLPTAQIQLPSGNRITAAVGTRVPGVGTFKEVSIHSVLVDDGKHVVALPFDGEDQAASVGGR